VPAMSALPTFVNGTVVAPASLTSLATNIDVLSQISTGHAMGDLNAERPSAKVLLQNPFSVPNSTTQVLAWDTVVYDTDFMFALSAADSLTVNTPGWYRIEAQVAWDLGAASERLVQIRCNGTAAANVVATSNTAMASLGRDNPVRIQVVAYEHLDADAQIACIVFQDSGVAVNALPLTTWGSWMAATWDAPF
jgi:hypothetical protein